jgi:hypothetical protein
METPFWKTQHRWKDNIKINPKEIGCENVDWIQLVLNSIQRWDFVSIVFWFH